MKSNKKNKKHWFTPSNEMQPSSHCPQCKADMAEAAVVCMNCGFNRLSSEFVDLPEQEHAVPRKRGPIRCIIHTLWVLLLITTAISLLVGYIFYEPLMVAYRANLPPKLKQTLPLRLERPYNPDWMDRMTHDALATVFEAQLRESLTETDPLYSPGQNISLELEDGRMGTGTYQGIDPEGQLILEIEGKEEHIPLASLKQACRIRADEAERAIYIYERAKRKATDFLH